MATTGYKKRLALDHMTGMSYNAVAKRYGHCQETVKKWLEEPEIAEYITEFRERQLSTLERALTRLGDIAINALGQVAADPDERGGDRVKAAAQIIELLGFRPARDDQPVVSVTGGDVTITPALRRALDE